MKSKPQKYPLNNSHLQKFKFYVNKWKEKLGLHSWNISVRERRSNNLAETHFDQDSSHKLCTIIKPVTWLIEPTDKNIESVVIHELMHVLLYDLVMFARTNPFNQIGIMEKEHEVVNTLEHLLGHRY